VRNTNTPQEEWFDIPTYAVDEKNMKFVLGLLHKEARNEFGQDYDKLRQRAMEQAGSVPG
jgi:hypothetical protein